MEPRRRAVDKQDGQILFGSLRHNVREYRYGSREHDETPFEDGNQLRVAGNGNSDKKDVSGIAGQKRREEREVEDRGMRR